MCCTLFRHVPAPLLAATRTFSKMESLPLFLLFSFLPFTKQCAAQPIPGRRSSDSSSPEMCFTLLEENSNGLLALWQKCVASWCLGGAYIGLCSAMTAIAIAPQEGVTFKKRSSFFSFIEFIVHTYKSRNPTTNWKEKVEKAITLSEVKSLQEFTILWQIYKNCSVCPLFQIGLC